ncbi:hypothetical protein [Planctomicrobium sp. SH664]|uniref:hypothetical protein n=1 Tax=Planctomicrobium sp. SH664 TaxID=3448125 RepID=UPI003F5B9532
MSFLLRFLPHSQTLQGFASGLITAALCIPVLTSLQLALGIGASSDCGLLLAATVACLALPMLIQWVPDKRWVNGSLLALATLWMFAVPSVLSRYQQVLAGVSLAQLDHRPISIGIHFGAGLLCLFPILLCCGVALQRFSRNNSQRACLLGAAVGFVAVPVVLSMGMNFSSLRWVALCSAVAVAAMHWRMGLAASSNSPTAPLSRSPLFGRMAIGPQFLLASVCGLGLACASFVGSQFVQKNALHWPALLCGLCVGGALGWRRSTQNKSSRRAQQLTTSALLTAASLGLLVSAVSIWMEISLQSTAWISHVGGMTLLRCGLLASFSLPFGLVLGRLSGTSAPPAAQPYLWLATCASACCLAMLSGLGVWHVSLLAILSALSLGIWSWSRSGYQFSSGRVSQGTRVALVAGSLLGLLFSGRVNSTNSDKILFSSRTFAALRASIPSGKIPSLDDGRHLATFEDLSSRWTAWKYRGSQIVARRNGLATELRSIHPEYCPHSAADVLPAILPLVLHPGPEHVLVLGVHTPTLQTCQSWPLHTVTTCDGDAGAHAMLAWQLEQDERFGFDGGAEFRFHKAEPVLAVQSKQPCKYDIVISPMTQPAMAAAATQSTREYYQHVAGLLEEGGLLCQRICYYDLGPGLVQQMLATVKSVFPEILLLESVPGEFLLIATNEVNPLVDMGCIDRLKSPQCRTALASAGWDWSTVMSRGGLTTEGVENLIGTLTTLPRCDNGGMAFSLPAEIIRWDAKTDKTRGLLAQQGKVLGSLLGEVPESQEITSRLEDLKMASQIQTDNPDMPWAYRAALKKLLTDRPRSEIIQVKHEGLTRKLYREDQARKDYLVALGKAATRERPPLDDVRDLAAFLEPFDPLISIFAHYEIAELLARAEAVDPAAQLAHRLHTVYYATADDHSVRNVTASLNLICEHPAAVADDFARWDQLNGLLEMLEQRWQLRWNDSRKTRYEPIDTEKSVLTIEKSLTLMDQLAEKYPELAVCWRERRESIDTTLLRPLREHRSAQMRQYSVTPR